MSILIPPKAYFDTNHLVNIARLRAGKPVPAQFRDAYGFINSILKEQLGVVFNFMSPIEWLDGRATLETARELARVIDSAALQYLYEGDDFVSTAEVLSECLRVDSSLNLPALDKLQIRTASGKVKVARGILAKAVPDFYAGWKLPTYMAGIELPVEIDVRSVEKYVEAAYDFRKRNPDSVKERVAGFKSALSDDTRKAIPRLNNTDLIAISDIVGWLKRYLRIDKILKAMNPGCDADSILERVEIENCPGLYLWFKIREKRIRAN